MSDTSTFLLVLADREAIWWVVSNGKMAFPSRRERDASMLGVNDRLLMYSTRGAWRNPTRDRGRVFGLARVASRPETLDSVVMVGERAFASGCALHIDGLSPYPHGVDFGSLVPLLHAFPKKHGWAGYLRRPLVALDEHDYSLIKGALEPLLSASSDVLEGYRLAARSGESGEG